MQPSAAGTIAKAVAARIGALRGWRRALVAVAAGALSALAFAPFNWFAVPFATVPVLVWLIDGAAARTSIGARIRAAAASGWLFGFGFFLGGLWWIGAAFLVDGGGFVSLMPVAVLGLPAFLALFWAGAAAVSAAAWMPGAPRLGVFAIAFTVAEYARGHLLTGFPWNAFGYALTPSPLLMQSASLVGIWGLTLVAFFVFAAPAVLSGQRRGATTTIALAAVILAADVFYGAGRLALSTDSTVPGVELRLVQPSIPQDERWEEAAADAIMDQYAALSRMAPNRPSEPPFTLLLWPESAFPFFVEERPDVLKRIAELLPAGTSLVTGAARRSPGAGLADPAFNSVLVVADDSTVTGTYDKVHLVPFGEYLPWRGLFDALGLGQLVAIPGGFAPGTERQDLTVPGAPPFSPLVCYEVIFPDEVVPQENRPSWLLNITNDAWFGDTPGPYQHFAQSRVRAVEEGLPLVRVANSGISAIVDPYGRVAGSLPIDETAVLDGELPRATLPTVYARFGDSIVAAMLLISSFTTILCKVYLRFDRTLTPI